MTRKPFWHPGTALPRTAQIRSLCNLNGAASVRAAIRRGPFDLAVVQFSFVILNSPFSCWQPIFLFFTSSFVSFIALDRSWHFGTKGIGLCRRLYPIVSSQHQKASPVLLSIVSLSQCPCAFAWNMAVAVLDQFPPLQEEERSQCPGSQPKDMHNESGTRHRKAASTGGGRAWTEEEVSNGTRRN